MVTTLATNKTVAAKRLTFRGYRITEAQFYAYQEARTRKYEHLKAQYHRQYGPILTDHDHENLTSDLRMWATRWLARAARHG